MMEKDSKKLLQDIPLLYASPEAPLTNELPRQVDRPVASKTIESAQVASGEFFESWTLRTVHWKNTGKSTERNTGENSAENTEEEVPGFPTFATVLRFEIQLGNKMLRRISRVSISTIEKLPNGERRKTHLVETGDLSEFQSLSDTSIKVRNCALQSNHEQGNCNGQLQSRGQKVIWKLNWIQSADSFQSETQGDFDLHWNLGGMERWFAGVSGQPSPEWECLGQFTQVEADIQLHEKNEISTDSKQNLSASAQTLINQNTYKHGSGLLHRFDFPQKSRGWSWAMATDINSKAYWEILTLQPNTYFPTARTFLRIRCKGISGSDAFDFYPLKDFLRVRSTPGVSKWQFTAEKGDWRIQGEILTEVLDYLGDSFESTSGEVFFRASSPFSSSQLTLYYKGKMHSTLENKGTTSVEFVSPEKIKYIHFQI